NYFTGQSRADSSNFYEEGAGYPEIRMTGDFSIAADTTIIDSSRALTTQYYKFTTFTSGRYSIIGTLERPAEWRFGAVVTEPGGRPAIYIFNLEDGEDFGFLPKFSEIVIIPVNVKILDGEDLPLLNFTYSTFSFNLKQGALLSVDKQAITAIYPNPLIIGQHDEINFKFTAIDAQEIVVRILDSNGKVVKSDRLTNGSGFLSRSSFIWNGTDDQNELVSSGVYILQLKQDDLIIFKKFAVIRE
ncbi:MAG: T9SS type A sorting domain-containing protein, partial [bacterium]